MPSAGASGRTRRQSGAALERHGDSDSHFDLGDGCRQRIACKPGWRIQLSWRRGRPGARPHRWLGRAFVRITHQRDLLGVGLCTARFLCPCSRSNGRGERPTPAGGPGNMDSRSGGLRALVSTPDRPETRPYPWAYANAMRRRVHDEGLVPDLGRAEFIGEGCVRGVGLSVFLDTADFRASGQGRVGWWIH